MNVVRSTFFLKKKKEEGRQKENKTGERDEEGNRS